MPENHSFCVHRGLDAFYFPVVFEIVSTERITVFHSLQQTTLIRRDVRCKLEVPFVLILCGIHEMEECCRDDSDDGNIHCLQTYSFQGSPCQTRT